MGVRHVGSTMSFKLAGTNMLPAGRAISTNARAAKNRGSSSYFSRVCAMACG